MVFFTGQVGVHQEDDWGDMDGKEEGTQESGISKGFITRREGSVHVLPTSMSANHVILQSSATHSSLAM